MSIESTGKPGRLPKSETERQFLEYIRTNQLQAAVNTLVTMPKGEALAIEELADEHGMTALHWTVANRNAVGIRWLLDGLWSAINSCDRQSADQQLTGKYSRL